jgi:surface antigen
VPAPVAETLSLPVAGALVAAVAATAGAFAAPMVAVLGVGLIGAGGAGQFDREGRTGDRESRADEHRRSPSGNPTGWQLLCPAHGSMLAREGGRPDAPRAS